MAQEQQVRRQTGADELARRIGTERVNEVKAAIDLVAKFPVKKMEIKPKEGCWQLG